MEEHVLAFETINNLFHDSMNYKFYRYFYNLSSNNSAVLDKRF
jgi:hypothetical protein